MPADQQSTQPEDARRYLDPKVLARISGLELRARRIVEGFFAGMHRSPQRGLSIEFAAHRAYTQGDDIRHIDWKVFGKTDKYYVKEYEQETNLNLVLAVDCSQSMSYRSESAGLSKYEYGAAAAAAVAHLALAQHDSVGLALFDEKVTELIRPSNRSHHWDLLVKELGARVGPGKTSIERVLLELAERLPHRSLVFLVSDLFADPAATLRGLKRLQFARHEVVLWHILDDAELTFPFRGPVRFEGLEAEGRVMAEPSSLRKRYLAEMERFQTTLREACGRMKMDYSVFNTAEPLDVALSGYLATRSARIRMRSSRVLGG